MGGAAVAQAGQRHGGRQLVPGGEGPGPGERVQLFGGGRFVQRGQCRRRLHTWGAADARVPGEGEEQAGAAGIPSAASSLAARTRSC